MKMEQSTAARYCFLNKHLAAVWERQVITCKRDGPLSLSVTRFLLICHKERWIRVPLNASHKLTAQTHIYTHKSKVRKLVFNASIL